MSDFTLFKRPHQCALSDIIGNDNAMRVTDKQISMKYPILWCTQQDLILAICTALSPRIATQLTFHNYPSFLLVPNLTQDVGKLIKI